MVHFLGLDRAGASLVSPGLISWACSLDPTCLSINYEEAAHTAGASGQQTARTGTGYDSWKSVMATSDDGSRPAARNSSTARVPPTAPNPEDGLHHVWIIAVACACMPTWHAVRIS